MFTVLPQLVLILAIVALIMILLRRLPQVTVKEEEFEARTAPVSARSDAQDQPRQFLPRLREWVTVLLGKLRDFALSAKDQTIRSHPVKRFSEALHFPHLNRKRETVSQASDNKEQITKASDFVEDSNLAGAEQVYIKIIASDPSNQEAYEGLGKVYLEQKKYKDAQEVYEHLTKTYPDNDSYFGRLGLVRFNLGKYDQAIESYEKAIGLNPDKPSRIINLALCYEAKNDMDKAMETVEKAVTAEPENTQYLMMYADLAAKKGDTDKAVEIVEKVMELEPTNEYARQRLRELKY